MYALSGQSRLIFLSWKMFNDFSESISFPLIEPLDYLYLFGGQVVEFVDELVDLVFEIFDLGLFEITFNLSDYFFL